MKIIPASKYLRTGDHLFSVLCFSRPQIHAAHTFQWGFCSIAFWSMTLSFSFLNNSDTKKLSVNSRKLKVSRSFFFAIFFAHVEYHAEEFIFVIAVVIRSIGTFVHFTVFQIGSVDCFLVQHFSHSIRHSIQVYEIQPNVLISTWIEKWAQRKNVVYLVASEAVVFLWLEYHWHNVQIRHHW